MNKTQQDNIPAQAPEIPEVKRNKPGRKAKGYQERAIQDILNGTAVEAAQVFDRYIHRRRGWKKVSRDFLDACKYVIDHAIGKAKQKVEHRGGIVTYADLAKGAEELDKKPRPILADVEEIAQKYQEKDNEKGEENSTENP